MIWTPSPRPPMSEWPTNLMLRDATAFMSPLLSSRGVRRLKPATQKELPDARIGKDVFRAVRHPRASELQHDAVVGMGERLLGVLLDHQHRDAARAHALEQLEQLLHQDRRQADRRLVDQ